MKSRPSNKVRFLGTRHTFTVTNLLPSTAGMTTGSVDGNIFTMHNEGMVFVYRK